MPPEKGGGGRERPPRRRQPPPQQQMSNNERRWRAKIDNDLCFYAPTPTATAATVVGTRY